jgi:CubicO group peptidase (beta-lactamase class C family)
MQPRIFALLALALVAPPTFAAAAAPAPIPRVETIAQHYADLEDFMGAVLVGRGDAVLFSKAYGSANLELNVPNTVDTKFRIGSITKQFTAAAILLLEERGQISVNDPVKRFYPDAPAAWDKITIAHLANHSSGIPNFTSLEGFDAFNLAAHTPEDIVKFFRDKPLEFAPGAEMRYSNSGYVLLGVVIEKASGQTYADFLAKNICEPLDLKDTGVDSNTTILPNRAAGYVPGPNGRENAPFGDMTVPYAAGAMYSTVGDLHRWNQRLYGGKLLKPDTVRRMITPPTLPKASTYAFGLGIGKRANETVYEHGGAIDGFNSYLSYFPADQITIVALANINGASPNGIAARLGDVMHGVAVTLPTERVAITLPARKLPEYAGTYELGPGRDLVIEVLDDHLSVKPGRQRADPLFAEKKDRFFSRRFDVLIEFQRDKKRRITGLWLVRGDDRREARRKPD